MVGSCDVEFFKARQYARSGIIRPSPSRNQVKRFFYSFYYYCGATSVWAWGETATGLRQLGPSLCTKDLGTNSLGRIWPVTFYIVSNALILYSVLVRFCFSHQPTAARSRSPPGVDVERRRAVERLKAALVTAVKGLQALHPKRGGKAFLLLGAVGGGDF